MIALSFGWQIFVWWLVMLVAFVIVWNIARWWMRR